jgi:delta 1-pyrroline-5-carboxylate dehydrogenase
MSQPTSLLLIGALVAAGCSHSPPPTPQARVQSEVEAARAEARSVVTDPARAARADDLLVQLQQGLDRAGARSEALKKQVDALDRRQDATEAQFQEVLSAGDADRIREVQEVAAIRDQLARLLTPEEWRKSAAARRKLLELQLQPQPL